MRSAPHSALHIAARLSAGVLGSYLFAWGFIALLAAGLLALGVEFHEATDLAWMLGFLVYLASLCFAFIAARLSHVWLVLEGGGALMSLAGWWLSRSLA